MKWFNASSDCVEKIVVFNEWIKIVFYILPCFQMKEVCKRLSLRKQAHAIHSVKIIIFK